MNRRSVKTRGFTLVEVMVALAIVALALPALLVALSRQVDATAYLRDKSIASLIATNKLTELRILSRASQSLIQGRHSGTIEMAEREWFWQLESKATEVPQFFRVEINVSDTEAEIEQSAANSLYTLVAFMPAQLEQQQTAGAAP